MTRRFMQKPNKGEPARTCWIWKLVSCRPSRIYTRLGQSSRPWARPTGVCCACSTIDALLFGSIDIPDERMGGESGQKIVHTMYVCMPMSLVEQIDPFSISRRGSLLPRRYSVDHPALDVLQYQRL